MGTAGETACPTLLTSTVFCQEFAAKLSKGSLQRFRLPAELTLLLALK
jgi:hypothetical protein